VDSEGIVELGRHAVWPVGLATNVALGAGALVITIRRLRTPYIKLPKTIRVGSRRRSASAHEDDPRRLTKTIRVG
jgi:hypothetical protein